MIIMLLLLVATAMNLMNALGFWWLGERPPKVTFEMIDSGDSGRVDIRPQEVAVWRDRRGSVWPLDPESAYMHRYLGITHRSLSWLKHEYSGPPENIDSDVTNVDSYTIDVGELGWPMRCLAAERSTEQHGFVTPPQITSGMLVVFGFQWPNRVLWLGMVINELFYVLLIVSAFCSWRYGKRWLRRCRGHCLKCAYDLRGEFSEGCPECGWKRADAQDACGYSSAARSD